MYVEKNTLAQLGYSIFIENTSVIPKINETQGMMQLEVRSITAVCFDVTLLKWQTVLGFSQDRQNSD